MWAEQHPPCPRCLHACMLWRLTSAPPLPICPQECARASGCSGGRPADAFAFANAQPAVSERLYPYAGKATGCKAAMVSALLKSRPQEAVRTAPAPGYVAVGQTRQALLSALAGQPVAALLSVEPTFQVRRGRGRAAVGCLLSLLWRGF